MIQPLFKGIEVQYASNNLMTSESTLKLSLTGEDQILSPKTQQGEDLGDQFYLSHDWMSGLTGTSTTKSTGLQTLERASVAELILKMIDIKEGQGWGKPEAFQNLKFNKDVSFPSFSRALTHLRTMVDARLFTQKVQN